MHQDVFDRLQPIGLTPALMRALAALTPSGTPGDAGLCEPARVTEVHRETAVLHDGLAEFRRACTGASSRR
jgi:hypothetical protein